MRRALMQVYSLWLRDMRHFFRQRSRVAGAIGQPFILWIFLNAGFAGSFTSPSAADRTGYGDFLFPGIVVLIALFSAVFSTMSMIEDRRSGFLQGVLTAPVPRPAVVFSKLITGASLALLQFALFLVLTPFTGLHFSAEGILAATAVLIVIGMTLTNIGFIMSWKMTSTQGFHAIMNLLLIPLWLLSGAFFPLQGAAGWLQAVMQLNPMSYFVALFQHALFFGSATAHVPGAAFLPALVITLLSFIVFTWSSTVIARKA